MSNMENSRFVRILTRCKEVAAEQGLPPIIAEVYAASAEAPIEAFLTANSDYESAARSLSKDSREATKALNELDAPYRVARSAAAAVVKVTKLPDTLKKQPTDTDKVNAIGKLLDIIQKHAGQPWADTLLQGEFGTKGAKAVKEINEAIAADKAMNKAQMARATDYDPAYEAYLGFKKVIRDALGSSSKQYRRIHLRSAAVVDETDAPVNGAPAPAPPAEGVPAVGIA